MNTKHSLACKGKTGTWKRNAEQNKKMSEALKGRVFNKEHKKKLGLALKQRWKEGNIIPTIKHGMSDTKTFKCWQGMRKRCFNKNTKNYKDYGGRGITVCERWNKFENFLEDMGEKPDNMSLDRIDNNQGYSLENCRWTDWYTQASNKNNNVKFNGETGSQASRRLGSRNSCLVANRLFIGWDIERAFTTPARKINYPNRR